MHVNIFNFLSFEVLSNHSHEGIYSHPNLPIWSWGLARSCCDIFPYDIGYYRRSYLEGGNSVDRNYFYRSTVAGGSVIYIAAVDFPDFLIYFLSLSNDSKIILVSGLEDIGAPRELWNSPREEFRNIWNDDLKIPTSMTGFIMDSRLRYWYVQNFDLVGCDTLSCSDVQQETYHQFLQKVRPVPIGIDFHSLAGKNQVNSSMFAQSVIQQYNSLHTCRHIASNSFDGRSKSILVTFRCEFQLHEEHYKITRKELCALIRKRIELDKIGGNVDASPLNIQSRYQMVRIIPPIPRSQLWSIMAQHAYCFAPPGHGIDTHRVWEALLLGVMPIVITSSMDALYSEFPVIIVDRWEDAFSFGK